MLTWRPANLQPGGNTKQGRLTLNSHKQDGDAKTEGRDRDTKYQQSCNLETATIFMSNNTDQVINTYHTYEKDKP